MERLNTSETAEQLKANKSTARHILRSRILYWLNRADRERHPKRSFESLEKARDLSKRLREFKGFTKWWSAVSFAAVCMALIIGAAIYGQSKDVIYSNPAGVFQIIRRYDAFHYKFNQIGVGELAVTFCPNYEPQLSAGQTIWWLRYIDQGKCWDIQPKGFGYRLVRDAAGKPTLPPNCFVNSQDITQCKPNPLEARF